ncbi:MAG: HD-GYP domain-containing protein [Endomicrobiales bacterium]
MFRALASVENKVCESGNHAVRLARYSRVIATQLGLKGEFLELIESAAPLHDIGKIGIPDRILFKPDRLTPREEEVDVHLRGGHAPGCGKEPETRGSSSFLRALNNRCGKDKMNVR